MKTRLGTWLSFFIFVTLIVQGCAPASPQAPIQASPTPEQSAPSAPAAPTAAPATAVVSPTEAPAASTIKHGGILKVSFEDDASEMDPALSTSGVDNYIKALAYDGLVDWDPRTLEIVPDLAKSWDISPDGLKYSFHIREGVKFQNGDPLTVGDIKFTFERIMDPKTGSSRASYLDRVKSVETPDQQTVVLNMKEPYAPFMITLPYVLIQSQKYVEANGGKTSQTMMGTGPFMLKEWIPGQVIRLEKNLNGYTAVLSINRGMTR